MDRYKTEIRSLKEKYRGTIDVFCGMELDMFSDVPTEGFDYIIGSVHCLELDGEILGFDTKLPQTLAYTEKAYAQFCPDGAFYAGNDCACS